MVTFLNLDSFACLLVGLDLECVRDIESALTLYPCVIEPFEIPLLPLGCLHAFVGLLFSVEE